MTTGLIEMADREEEVAGVLAHELAHVGRRHVAKRMEKEKPLSIATLAGMLLGALIPGAGALGPALMTSTMAASQTLSLKFSREDEDEADRFGLSTSGGVRLQWAWSCRFLEEDSLYRVRKDAFRSTSARTLTPMIGQQRLKAELPCPGAR